MVIVNEKLEKILEEAVGAYFKPLSRNFRGDTKENYENRAVLKPKFVSQIPKCKAGAFTIRPVRSAVSIDKSNDTV
jgi:hypothetical protein